jgi:hypothetical protein
MANSVIEHVDCSTADELLAYLSPLHPSWERVPDYCTSTTKTTPRRLPAIASTPSVRAGARLPGNAKPLGT